MSRDICIPSVCAACGGRCCQIYKPASEGGAFPDGHTWFTDWLSDWYDVFEESGAFSFMPPLFDPIIAHENSGRGKRYREALRRAGIDPDYCQYWSLKGCLLPRDKRPAVCREYACERLQQAIADADKNLPEGESVQCGTL
jgi:hypothetical protein